MVLCMDVFAYISNMKCYHLILIAFLVYFNNSFFKLFVRIHEIITGTCILHKEIYIKYTCMSKTVWNTEVRGSYLVSGPPNDRGEHAPWGIVPSKPSFTHPRSIVNDKSCYFVGISHFNHTLLMKTAVDVEMTSPRLVEFSTDGIDFFFAYVLAYKNIINIKGSLKYLFYTWYWLLKYFAMASISTIPPVVEGRSESFGRIGVVKTTASVLAERLARRIPYTFCPGMFWN